LQELSLGISFYDEVKKVLPSKNDYGYTSQEIEEKKEELQKLWESLGGKDVNPFNRDQYHCNFEDDAMLITKELIENLKKVHSGVEVFDADEIDEFTVADLKEESIGSWLVVIDYHN